MFSVSSFMFKAKAEILDDLKNLLLKQSRDGWKSEDCVWFLKSLNCVNSGIFRHGQQLRYKWEEDGKRYVAYMDEDNTFLVKMNALVLQSHIKDFRYAYQGSQGY